MTRLEATPESDSDTPSARLLTRWLVGGMVLLVVLTIALRTFVVESCPVIGPSMEPTLNEGERVLVWKLPAYLARLAGPQTLNYPRNTLVVFERPEERGRRYIKRLIASSMDDAAVDVNFEKGRVFVGNQLVDEPYLVPEERTSPIDYKHTLKPREFFLLGDHRSVSKDSLTFGPIGEDQVIGRAFFRIWPLSKAGAL